MDTRFINAVLLPDAASPPIEGELWVENGEIAYVGPPKRAATAFQKTIDAHGNLLLPGFKNAHTHSAMTFLRSIADDLPLTEWLHTQVFPMEALLTPDDIQPLATLAILEYLSGGITACFDMYPYPQQMAQAAISCGFRAVLCGAINNFVGSVPQMERDYQQFNAMHPLISYQLGFHAEYTTDLPLLQEISVLSHKLRAPVFTHCCETVVETEECIQRYGLTPPALFSQLGLLDYGGGLFHGVHLTAQDRKICARQKVAVLANPGSNCKLASGIPPLVQLHQAGVLLGLGTDGPASNNALDIFREIYLAAVLPKLANHDAAAMDAGWVLEAALSGGARAIGLVDCDRLAPGKKADMTLLDLHQPNMLPLNNLIKNIVYSGGKQNVLLTMINGEILYEGGRFLKTNLAQVSADVNRIVEQKRRLFAQAHPQIQR